MTTGNTEGVKARLLALAKIDREATVTAMFEALRELDVIRPVNAAMIYDHRLIGSHEVAKRGIAQRIADFLYENDVIDLARRPAVGKGGGSELTGSLYVLIPMRLQLAPARAQEQNG